MSEITILVGTPGAGKTLYAVSELRKEFSDPIEIDGKEIKRQVYFHNIPGITIDEWKQLDDPSTWHTLPVGSVIIIDEAHEAFPTMDHKKEKPEHILRAADLRHRGHTLVLITQHPNDLHIFLRRRCTRFIYLQRPLNQGPFARAFQWPKYEEKYDWDQIQEKADKFQFDYPKEAFGTYKSSQLHTKKRYVPKSLKKYALTIAVCIAVLIGAVTYISNTFFAPINEEENLTENRVLNTVKDSLSIDDIDEYFQKHMPRITGLPHTAPQYDQLTEPKVHPRLNCISSKTKCICYTQQATRAETTDEICRDIVENGYFDSTIEVSDNG